MPDLATVVPIFNVESIERTAEDVLDRRSRRRVEFESTDFNKRFIATVPRDHDPVALRELFSPAFIDWITRIPAEVDFGITDRQLFFHWRLRELTREELKEALHSAGGIFDRLHRDGGEQPRHLQGRSLERRARAVPRDDRLAARASLESLASGPVKAEPFGGSRGSAQPPLGQLEAADDSRGRRHQPLAAGELPSDLDVSLPLKSGACRWTVRQARPSSRGRPAGSRPNSTIASRVGLRSARGRRAGSRRERAS